MSKKGIIQSLFKGVSFYLPKENSSVILKDLIIEFSRQKELIKHFFIYLDNRFECRFRIFIHSNLTSKEIEKLFNELLKPYIVQNQKLNSPKQLFKTFEPYTIVPIKNIQFSDEIYTFSKNIEPICNYLKNLTTLIANKLEELDIEDENQNLEFTLELLLSSLNTCEVSNKQLLQYYKASLKNNPAYKEYLEKQYGALVDKNKENILHFRKSLLKKENADNPFNVFWKKNGLKDYKMVIELIFKVLNLPSQNQSYCLYILHKNAEKIASN